MRRLIPIFLISALSALSLVAILLSLHDSTPIAFFSHPTPGDPAAVRTFRDDVKATLNAPNFIFGGIGTLGPIEYQSPNRTKDLSKLATVIVIGRTSYQELSGYKNSVTQWGEGSLTSEINKLFGPVRVKFALREFLNLTSVRRVSGGFVAKQIVPAADISPGTPGQALIFWSVKTHGGFVTNYRGTAHGLLQSHVVVRKTHLEAVIVKSIHLEPGTYSKFGLVPQIVAPPKNKTVKLVPCKNGDTSDYGNAGYTCGSFGT
jgi:hypothetical protein